MVLCAQIENIHVAIVLHVSDCSLSHLDNKISF